MADVVGKRRARCKIYEGNGVEERLAACSITSWHPWDSAEDRGGASPQETGGPGLREARESSVWWNGDCAAPSSGPAALGRLRGHRIVSQPITRFHFKHLPVAKFKLIHHNHVELECF